MKGVYTENISNANEINKLRSILEVMKPDLAGQIYFERFHDNGEGVDRAYNVYKVISDVQTYILKKSDGYEIEVYEKFLRDKNLPVPKLEGWTSIDNTKWILIEYIAGEDLRMFDKHMAYGCAESLSRTLCNGDFLQCNAIKSNYGIVLIDWAFAGIMPYSLDAARLITHGSEKFFPFPFYMTDEYKKIFVKALYDKLQHKPDYKQFIWDIILSCLNECIEFIERELNDESIERDDVFNYYYKNAQTLADIILEGKEMNITNGTISTIF